MSGLRFADPTQHDALLIKHFPTNTLGTMHRFRTSRVPNFSPVSRARLVSYSAATEAVPKPRQPHPLNRASVAQGLNNEIRRLVRGPRQTNVVGCQELVDVREMISIYRKHRDDAATAGLRVPASEAVHCILETIRQRMITLRPVISSVRAQIIARQNEELLEYLQEIVQDVVKNRSYLSAGALTYLFTAFSTMECHVEATQVWILLNESKQQLPDVPEKLQDPRVVGAILSAADPSTISVNEIEKVYEDTVEKHGVHIFLDEALAKGYLRFHEYSKALLLYRHMRKIYDEKEWDQPMIRLHNHILTECPDIEIASKLFESSMRLHPSAVAGYVRHTYEAVNDPSKCVEIYGIAMKRLRKQGVSNKDCQILTTETTRKVAQHYPLPTPEAQQLFEEILKAANYSMLALNTVLSTVAKRWTESNFVLHLQDELESRCSPLRFDSLRILLNSSRNQSVSLERITKWWEVRKNSNPNLQYFDWLALSQACDFEDRASYFVREFVQAREIPEKARLFSQLERQPHIQAAMASLQLTKQEPMMLDHEYSAQTVAGELAAH